MNMHDIQPIPSQPQNQTPHSVAPLPKKRFIRLKNWLKVHKRLALAVTCTVLLIIAAISIFIIGTNKQDDQFTLTIGDTTITQADLDRYKQGLSEYKQANPDARIEGNPDDLAMNAVIMNAALKKEAKQYNKTLTSDEIKQIYSLSESQSPDTYYKQITSGQFSEGNNLAYYDGITKENLFLQRKLYDDLIGKRALTYASVSFDAPYFRDQFNNPEALEKLHQEAQQRLKAELLPLFKSRASKEDIGKKADVNYIANPRLSNPDIFFKKVVTTAAYMPNYNDTLTSVEATQAMPPGPDTNLNDVAESFKDLNDVNYGIKVPDLKDTAAQIATLQNVGDSTGVFASKTGAYMIVRLEDKQGGQYSNWQAFVDAYKPKQQRTSSLHILKDSAQHLVAQAIQRVPMSTASAEACSAHTVTMSITMLDVDTKAVVAGNVSLTQGGTCGAGNRSSSTGQLSFLGNCYAPEPSVSYTVPSGYTFQAYQSSDWNPENINQKGYWQAFIYVKRDTRKVTGQSNMVPDDGQPSFGSNPSSFNHTITAGGYYPYISHTFSVSGSWNLPIGSSSYPVTASAPGSFTDSKGTWSLVGETMKTRNATAANGWNATIQFRYRLGGGPPPPTDGPTCSLSVSPSTLPQGGGTVTVSWSSTKNKQGSISPIIGALGNAGAANSRFGGSQEVSVTSSTTFTGLWVAEDGKQAQCTATVTVGVTPPPPPPAVYKPYIRVYGNDVTVGSAFRDDFNECTGYDYDAKIRANIGWNDQNYNTGSSGQFGVFNYALGSGNTPWEGGIDGFFSNNTDARATPGQHNSNNLVFGNHYSRAILSPRGDGQYQYIYNERVTTGGNSGILHCNPNFFKDFKDKGATIVSGGTLSSIDPSLTAPISNGARKSLVVDGNLFIDRDITYANTTWSSVSSIPNVSIIVRGNISIAKNVSRIDGLIVAQPKCSITLSQGQQCPADKLIGGEVYSCGTAAGPLSLNDVQAECDNQLVINGTVIARSARWYRSVGTVSCPDPSPLECEPAVANEPASSSTIAEVINFSPELYLAPLNRQQNNNGPLQKYDSITSLPPVL